MGQPGLDGGVTLVVERPGDHGTAAVFEEMGRDEEKNADCFGGQLDTVERVGITQYLASRPRATPETHRRGAPWVSC